LTGVLRALALVPLLNNLGIVGEGLGVAHSPSAVSLPSR
jgi:hypothetical protein